MKWNEIKKKMKRKDEKKIKWKEMKRKDKEWKEKKKAGY